MITKEAQSLTKEAKSDQDAVDIAEAKNTEKVKTTDDAVDKYYFKRMRFHDDGDALDIARKVTKKYFKNSEDEL